MSQTSHSVRCKAYRAKQQAFAGVIKKIEIARIDVVEQPRKRFDPDRLAELVESIRAEGLLQPLVVREMPGERFELVAGERRLRACRLLEHVRVVCLVRELDARAAARLRIIENLQRENLDPIEEAEGMEAMLLNVPEGERMTQRDLAAQLHKHPAYIHEALLLLRLPEIARQALLDRRIGRVLAVMIARVSDTAKREEFAQRACEAGKEMTVRQATQFLRGNAGRQLSEAIWDLDSAEVLPAAGSCAACVKRCRPDQPAEGDICPDADCYQAKRHQHLRTLAEREAAAGREVLDAARVFDEEGKLRWDSGVVAIDQPVAPELVKPAKRDQVGKKTWAALIGDTAEKATQAAISPTGEVVHVLPVAVAVAAAEQQGHKVFAAVPGSDYDDAERERRKKKRAEAIEERIRERIEQEEQSALYRVADAALTGLDADEERTWLYTAILALLTQIEDGIPEEMSHMWALNQRLNAGHIEPRGIRQLAMAKLLLARIDAEDFEIGDAVMQGLGIKAPPLGAERVAEIRREVEAED